MKTLIRLLKSALFATTNLSENLGSLWYERSPGPQHGKPIKNGNCVALGFIGLLRVNTVDPDLNASGGAI